MGNVVADLLGPALLLFLGLGLLVAEVFLPSGGIIGLLAFAFCGASVYLAYAASPAVGFRWAILEGVMIPLTWGLTFTVLSRTRFGRQIFLQPPDRPQAVPMTTTRPPIHPVGATGHAVTPLRPSGMIEIAGRRVEALAESGLIAVGTAVTVVGVRSGSVVVRAG